MDIEFRIKKLIQYEGKISLNRFMEEVISHEEYSYYNSSTAIGADGDFITSPEVSQLFGEMIGVWCANVWQSLGSPSKIALIELGPGKGTLISDILRATKHISGFHNSIELHFIEISDQLKKIQQDKILNYDIKKNWYKSIKELSIDIPVIFISNEFFDALPICQYKKVKNSWHEKFIELNKNFEFTFTDLQVSTKTEEDLNLEFPYIEDGSIVEVCKSAIEHAIIISQMVKKNTGASLIIDYGYFISSQSRTKTFSTLQAIKNHKYHSLLKDIGKSDVSAHVDFYKLTEVTKLYDLNYRINTQKDFLINLGIIIRAQQLAKNASYEAQENIYRNLDRLIAPDKMGDLFKVMTIYNAKQ